MITHDLVFSNLAKELTMLCLKNRLASGLLATAALLVSPMLHSEVIFEENFDSQPDWNSGLAENALVRDTPDTVQRASTHNIPNGWYSIRQDPQWAPSVGVNDKHETIEILAANSDKSRGGSGKSMVSWRESYDNGNQRWTSESIMLKYFPEGYDQIYVEFWIRFDPNWSRLHVTDKAAAYAKLFRISSWSGEGDEYRAFTGGNLGPMMLWDHTINSYGLRDTIALRGGPHGDNYKFATADIPGLPRYMSGIGDLSLNFTENLAYMGPGGTRSLIEDRVNGGVVPIGKWDTVQHDQIFGPGDAWTKIAFFVKMNSAPDVQDGELRQFLNGHQIFFNAQIPWIRSSATEDNNAKWNIIAFGGNDSFLYYPNGDRREEWYSIDDIVVRTDIPDYLESGINMPPNPPSAFYVK
jgi:hypothetical protein